MSKDDDKDYPVRGDGHSKGERLLAAGWREGGVQDLHDDDDLDEGWLQDDEEATDQERERASTAMNGRQWTEVGSSLESNTEALEIHESVDSQRAVLPSSMGCVLRVRARGLDQEPMLGLVWLPGVTLADVQTDPTEARRILESRGHDQRQPREVIGEALLNLETGDLEAAKASLKRWMGIS